MNLTLIAGFSGAGVALVIAVIGWIYSNGRLSKEIETLKECLTALKHKVDAAQAQSNNFVTSSACSGVQMTVGTQFTELKQLIRDSEDKRERFNKDLLLEIRELYKYMGENGIINRRKA